MRRKIIHPLLQDGINQRSREKVTYALSCSLHMAILTQLGGGLRPLAGLTIQKVGLWEFAPALNGNLKWSVPTAIFSTSPDTMAGEKPTSFHKKESGRSG
jgi:hypothetical protein